MQPGKPGDDPRIGHGPVERPLPALPVGRAALVALLVFVAGLAAWEWHWRDYGAPPGFVNSDGQWAIQRRRIDNGEGNSTVIIGASRLLFGLQLPVWERLSGHRPIQLALEGTSPLPILEDLAADPDFTGHLLVGVSPDVFFSGYVMRSSVLERYRDETPSQRAGEWLSMHLLEPRFAFLDPDFALFTVIARQDWPVRGGVDPYIEVRKLSVSDADRNTWMWDKVERDPDYRALSRKVWSQFWENMPPPSPDVSAWFAATMDEQIERAAAAVATLRARGADVVFVRPPSDGEYLAFEEKFLPRTNWDLLLARTGAPGIHFQDHADMQGLELPEWSHLSKASAERYTEALYRAWSGLQQQAQPGR